MKILYRCSLVALLLWVACTKETKTPDNTVKTTVTFERKTTPGGPGGAIGGGHGEEGGCPCLEGDWHKCLNCGNTCGGCCVRIRSAHPPPYSYRFECRYMGPASGEVDPPPTMAIDLTPTQMNYHHYNLTRAINGGTPVQIETNATNPDVSYPLFKYNDFSAPSNWQNLIFVYTLTLYDVNNNLLATEVWKDIP